MRILFVSSTLNLGGVETYLSRIIPVLVSAGYIVDVHVLNRSFNSELCAGIQRCANVVFVSKYKKLGNYHIFSRKLSLDYDLIFTTGASSLLYVALSTGFDNLDANPIKAKVIAGVYSQFEYLNLIKLYRNKLASDYFGQLPIENIVFCTDGCKEDHSKYYGHAMMGSMVSPLYMDLPSDLIMNQVENKSFYTILSVGRLVDFKTYNLYMPEIIRRLLDSQIFVRWIVVGTGPLISDMRRLISDFQVDSYVEFVGNIQYADLHGYYDIADLYIGAGTTLIEASSRGVPSICTIDGIADPVSTGFLHERDGFVTSDCLSRDRQVEVFELIEGYFRLSDEDKITHKQRAYSYSKKYSIINVVEDFNELIKAAKLVSVRHLSFSVVLDFLSILMLGFRSRVHGFGYVLKNLKRK